MANSNLSSRFKSAWNAFFSRDPTLNYQDLGASYYYRPDRVKLTNGNEKSIINAIYNRISLDVAALTYHHVLLDESGRFNEVYKSGLDSCLNLEANIDQTGRAFIQDAVMSMLDEGCVALIPIDTDMNPNDTSSYDILSMRTGKITQWYPCTIRAEVYNDREGKKEEIIVSKMTTAILENPFYSVMNEQNSTMQRLIRKLNLLDVVDEQSSAGKLDLIIQLPYVVKSEARKAQADSRRKEIEEQLRGSKYGIAYTDGTEHITQLNRPAENNLMSQIEYLQNLLFSQLGITTSILDGTADEAVLTNYYDRTIEPIAAAIVDELKRKFLSKTARSRNQSIQFFRDPFRLVPVSEIAELADKFTRNEILTSNEVRQIIGLKPSDDPEADELRNKNLSKPNGEEGEPNGEQNVEAEMSQPMEEIQNE